MSELSNKAVVDKEQELRPVRFTETGRMRLGKILKAARQTTGWSVSETEFKTKGYEEALFTATNQPVPKDVGISAATVNRYERGKLDNLDWRSLSLLCFVLKPIDPVTGEAWNRQMRFTSRANIPHTMTRSFTSS